MENPNQKIVEKFFEAYGRHAMDDIKKVMSENVLWYFRGKHPYAGVKRGIPEVVSFFDTMGKIMGDSKPTIEKVIVGENENHFFECSHITTNRMDGHNVDHHVSVVWTIEDGKITEGRHFFADPGAIDQYFNAMAKIYK